MTFTLQSTDVVSFEVNALTSSRFLVELRKIAAEQFEASFQVYMTQKIMDRLVDALIDQIEEAGLYDSIVSKTVEAMTGSYMGYIVEGLKETVAANLINNQRFQTLLNRNITNITNGVIDETVERVSARFENLIGQDGDV